MKSKKFIFWTLIVISLAMIIIGLANGEFQMVWLKAKTVCLECIGLG